MVSEDMRNISSINRKNTFNVPREQYYVKISKDGKRVKDSWIREANKYIRFIGAFVVGVIDSENKVIVGEEAILTRSSRGLYANVISFDSRDRLDAFINELDKYNFYTKAKDLIESQNLFDICVYIDNKKGFTTINGYMDYKIPVIKKDLDALSALFNRDSLLSPIYGDIYTDLRKCNVTISVESNGGLDSPVIVNCYCNFAKCLKDNKDLELHLKSLSSYRGKDSQYIRIEYMGDLSTLVVTF